MPASRTITELPTSSFFSSADSFAMIRGGHIDLTVLGAMEVAENGDIANWTIPGKMLKGMGGAMDLVAGVKARDRGDGTRDKQGQSKVLKRCTLPLTGAACVDMVITDLCVFNLDRFKGGLTLIELAPDVTLGRNTRQDRGVVRCGAFRMTDAFICDAVRTPIGRFGGALAHVRADDLAAIPIKALMARNTSVDWGALDEVFLGCANQAGEDNRNVARMAALLSGLPERVPGTTINRLCASGLDCGWARRRGRYGRASLNSLSQAGSNP